MSRAASRKEIEITKDLTIPKLFLQSARKYWDKKVAMREKEFGIWTPITWKQYYDNVKHIALGMVSLGVERGDRVAMIGDNRPEALWAEMATMCVGGVGIWLFHDSLIDEVQYIMNHSDAKLMVGEGQCHSPSPAPSGCLESFICFTWPSPPGNASLI